MYSEKKIYVSKVKKLQGGNNTITEKLNTRIKKEESEDEIQRLKSVISENIRIIDNKCLENVDILRVKYELKGELKRVREERDVAVAHTKNLNRQYKNSQVTVSDTESYQIKLQSLIDDLTSDLVVSRESANKIKTNWTTTSIVKIYLDNM